MKVITSEIIQVEKWVEVTVNHKGKKLKFNLITIDGKVKGEFKNNFATSYLTYFHETSDKLMQKHWQLVKTHIEINHK